MPGSEKDFPDWEALYKNQKVNLQAIWLAKRAFNVIGSDLSEATSITSTYTILFRSATLPADSGGVIFSALNPFFLIWWFTVGLVKPIRFISSV